MTTRVVMLPDAQATAQLGERVAVAFRNQALSVKTVRAANTTRAGAAGDLAGNGFCVHLQGDLGAGKTTFAQGFLHQLGVEGVVRSPTYTLVESYETFAGRLLHVDLYRVSEVNEIEALDLREEWQQCAALLIEWPERGGASAPRSDLSVQLEWLASGRKATLTSDTDWAVSVLEAFDQN
jgi:tRNA threonylcarbamoyladenosine biosynthesis protein TsaE